MLSILESLELRQVLSDFSKQNRDRLAGYGDLLDRLSAPGAALAEASPDAFIKLYFMALGFQSPDRKEGVLAALRLRFGARAPPPYPRDPMELCVHLASLPAPGTPRTIGQGGRLRVALCVSGQLRGYAQAVRTWGNLGLASHDCDVFVHTWRHVGRRAPEGRHAERTLSGPLLEAFQAGEALIGYEGLQAAFPEFFAVLLSAPRVGEAEVKRAFGATQAVVEDETDERFRLMTNQEKMLHKIRACHELAINHRDDYDLVIRIRPDRIVKKQPAPIDWGSLYERSVAGRQVFTNGFGSWLNRTGYKAADQFAAGAPAQMAAYGSAETVYGEAKAAGAMLLPQGELGFDRLGYSLFLSGVLAAPTDIALGGLCEVEGPAVETMCAAALADIRSRRDPNPADAVLLEAIGRCGPSVSFGRPS